MAFVAVFDGRKFPIDRYDSVVSAGGPAVWRQPERSHHVCYESDGGFVVVDVWESEDAFGRFGEEVIGPAMAAAGVDLQPQVHRVHNVHRGGDANVATVRAMYEAFGRGDIPAILECLADDVDWEAGRVEDHGVPWLRQGQGKAHVVSFFETLGAIEFKRFEPKTVMGDGDTVLAVIELEAVVTATGATLEDLEVHVWTFNADGSVRSLRHVVDTVVHARAVRP